jgi:hypothetical protein
MIANITNLTVSMRMIRPSLILSLLEGCAPLLAFNLLLQAPGGRLSARGDVARAAHDILEMVYKRHGTTLQSLALTTARYRSFGFYRHYFSFNHSILRAFSRLKSLDIPPMLFIGQNAEHPRPSYFFADILPASLRRLSLSGGVFENSPRGLSTAHLEGLGVAIDQGRFPYPRKVHVLPWRKRRIPSYCLVPTFLDRNIAESWRARRPGCELLTTPAPRQLRDWIS